jgi:hypothetical protein
MQRLLNEYVPAVFLLGKMLRDLNWGCRAAGTGREARRFLTYALLTLRGLLGDACSSDEYVRGIGLALIMWTPWHSAIPGCLYTEEYNEAALSRLGQLCRSHPHAITCAEVMDLYLLVEPANQGWHRLHQASVPTNILQRVAQGIVDLVNNGAAGVSFVPWIADRQEPVAQAQWSTTHDWPLTLSDTWTPEAVKETLRAIQVILHRQNAVPSEEVQRRLRQHVPSRNSATRRTDREEVSRLLAH